jgi:hypothetical protein
MNFFSKPLKQILPLRGRMTTRKAKKQRQKQKKKQIPFGDDN